VVRDQVALGQFVGSFYTLSYIGRYDRLMIRSINDRSTLRRSVRIDCEVVSERGFRLLARRALDLSTDGMLVQSEAQVEVGDDVIVSFTAPGGRFWMDAEATVARVVRGIREGDRVGRCLGLRFRTLENTSRAVLAASLRGLPPPIPSRHVRRDYASTVRLIHDW
jgi:hypothetical protein